MAVPVFNTGDVPTAAQFNQWLVNIAMVRKASQTDRATNTTLADDPELTIAVAANSIYVAEVNLFYQSQTAQDLKFQLLGPAGATYRFVMLGLNSTSAALYTDDQSAAFDIGTSVAVSGVGSSLTPIFCKGLLRTAGTAGNFKVQWAQNTSGAASSMMIDSYIDLRQVG